jgi:DNA (cytosine-5)-methyltransferase 1
MGYHRAGFDVTGVDIEPQPRYPFEFHQGDAMTWPLDGFDAIHASPPCQDHMRGGQHQRGATGWMLAQTRARLSDCGVPWVIENVPGAPMRADYRLCGCMFGLRISDAMLVRERWFETFWRGFDLRAPCSHDLPVATITGKGTPSATRKALGRNISVQDRRDLLGVPWMGRDESSQAIPPAYTEYIGARLLEHLAVSERSCGRP